MRVAVLKLMMSMIFFHSREDTSPQTRSAKDVSDKFAILSILKIIREDWSIKFKKICSSIRQS